MGWAGLAGDAFGYANDFTVLRQEGPNWDYKTQLRYRRRPGRKGMDSTFDYFHANLKPFFDGAR
jgi:hypothetical protein